ncbi:MAG: Ig-like domain repeat protein, partial [Terracidiphilus sp.]
MKLAMKHIELPSMHLLVEACGLITLLALVPALVAQNAAQPVSGGRLAKHTAPQVLDGSAVRVGHYSPEKMLRLVLAIKPPHMAEEEQFLKDLQTKGSPNFHKFLTPEEWNARFAPSAEDERKVVDWAVSQGFTVTNRYNHRLIVDVEAPAGVIENAFGVTINNYQYRDEIDFANDMDPMLPTSLSGIVYNVQGLNNIQREHGSRPGPQPAKGPDYSPGPLVVQAGADRGDGDPVKAASIHASNQVANQASNDGSVSNLTGGFMDPSDIYSSQTYNYGGLQALSHCCNVHNDSTGSPKETSIAIAGFGNFLSSDISGFMNAYGLSWNWTSYNIAGTPGCSTSSETPPCATGETTEDVEWSIATSNNPSSSNLTAHEYIYLGGNYDYSTYTTMYSQILSDNLTRIMSTSWSCTEIYDCDKPTMDSRHSIFNNMVGEGWTLIAASGDRGASDDCQNNIPSSGPKIDPSAHTAVAYPASDYDFVAAGGTQLMLYGDGTWDYENAWQGGFGAGSCNGNGGGSGGGVSAYYAAPSWQSTLVSPYYSWVGSQEYEVTGNTMRLSPDLSLNALGIGQNLYINGSMSGDANGTSVVAPELAGFFAQENTYLNYIGSICGSNGTSACTPVGNPNSYMYEDAISGAQHNPFYNMLSGCSSNDATQQDGLTFYCAGPGSSVDISGTGNQYDLVSGWGSANMMQLAWGINWELIPAYGSPSVAFSGPATSTWYNTNQTVSWTVSDAGSSGLPAPGVAGFTQGWDSIPADPYSEPNGGSGNSFYSGPEYPFGTTGCLAFSANGCSGNGGAQGCHTVHVRGWDNQGVTTGDRTYGPLCYDTVAPTIAIDTNVAVSSTGWFNIATGDPYVSLVATDPGGSNASGVKTIYGVLGPTTCSPTNLGTCQIYGPPFQILQGANPITAFSLDNAGNFSTVAYETLWLDTVAPVTTDSLVGQWNNGTSTSAVTVTLNATDATSGVEFTYYTLDGGSATVYTAPFVISTAGSHTLKYWSVDWANNTEAQNTATFAIKSPTTASVVAAPNPSMLGQSVTITATVVATLTGTPTGSVTFWNGSTNLGTSTLSGGVASITTSALPAGLLTLQASYNGATYFVTTNSPPYNQTVNENTTTAVTISPNPLVFGQTSTLTATVTPAVSGTPTGSVDFKLNGGDIGTISMSGGVATTSTAYFGGLTPGSYSVTANYSGDSTYLASGSSTFTLTVKQATQTITFPAITGTEYATTTMPLSATASSGLMVAFASTTPSIC